MSNFYWRVISAIFLILIVLACFYFRSSGVTILSGIISILLYSEVIRNLDGYKANKLLLFLPFIGLAEAFFVSDLIFVFLLFVLILIIAFYPSKQRWFRLISFSYIFISQYLFLTVICEIPDQLNIKQALFLLLIVIASDIGGYIFGNLFGKNKIARNISPNKTWEGFFGANLLSIIVWIIAFRGFSDNLILEFSLVVTLSLFSQVGDLIESYGKRILSVKDSGGLIPGHGGVFDRMDSFLGAIFGYSLIISLGFGM